MAVRQEDAPTRPHRAARRVVLPVGALSAAVGALALVTAPGATTVDGTTYDTTFVTGWLWWLAYAVVPVAAVLAWRARASYLAYVATGTVLVVPQVVVAAVVAVRYQLSGWGSGLEFLAFLHPVGLFFLTAVVLGAVGAVDAAHRRRRPTTT
ncbi:hypothetical protein WDZ17_08470 [Pseudokineococcus basanitobsidens]|uniref:Integral membrane protein n=1 Tax=Pseudokineococcus basanitobsidens TaxID=1926649 RepID=A0ABU8RJP7_9ACTN